MSSWSLNNTIFRITRGNLAEESVDAIAIGVSGDLLPAGPSTGAIFGAAGNGLQKHVGSQDSEKTGQVLRTPGFGLRADYIYLVVLKSKNETKTPKSFLGKCFQALLDCVNEDSDVSTFSTRPLGLGDFGFPIDTVSRAGIQTIHRTLLAESFTLAKLNLVVYDAIQFTSVNRFGKEILESNDINRIS